MDSKHVIFTEVFPVQQENLPQLFAYKLDVVGGNIATIGGKLSYRLRRRFPGHWVWASYRIITDKPQSQTEIMELIEDLWQEDPTVYKGLRGIEQDTNWKPSPQAQAQFIARGLFSDIHADIQRELGSKARNLGNARVERVYDTRGWVVANQPAVSISISSRMVYKEDLKTYAARIPDPQDLKGLWVADKTSTLKGEVVRIPEKLVDHKRRLLALTQREEMQEIIQKAPDDELVVSVLAGRYEYDYVVSALRIVLRMEDLNRFGVNPQQTLRTLRLEPRIRADLVKAVSDIAKSQGLITSAYNSRGMSNSFISPVDVGFDPYLRFGNNQDRRYDDKRILQFLRQCGLYKPADPFKTNVPISIGIINALGTVDLNGFLSRLEQELQSLRFSVSFTDTGDVQSRSRVDLEKATKNLQDKNPHIILAFFPDEDNEDDEEWGAYHHFKSIVIGQGIASQVVYQSTLNKQYAMANIVLGILGKTGNIPFILGEPLKYADLVVGIDIARQRKERLPGSINATAIARIYFSDGEFLRYIIHDTPLEGETIPESVIQTLFPLSEFQGKRVVIHRDGYFRGDEKQALKDWAGRIGAKFFLVEVIKTGTPRLYALVNKKTQQPPKGSAFKLSETEAFLVSSLPPFKNATPQPLRIRTELPFTIEQAIHSVLSLTLLHYGSLRPPRLPVTIHYSDRIAYLALRGIKPKNLEGSIPFWL